MNTVAKNRPGFISKTTLIKVIQCLFLIAGGILFMAPLIWLVSNSFKENAQIWTYPPVWIPKPVVFKHYLRLLDHYYLPMDTFIINSFKVTIGVLIGNIFSTVLVSYAFARLKCKLKNFYFIVLLGTMMIPGQVILIPVFILYKYLHWLNTFYALIVPAFFGNAFFIFLMRQFMMTIPYELDESALIDGASNLQILTRIILPLCKPILITVGIFSFIWTWTDFYGPLIFLTKMDKMTLAVGITLLQGQRVAEVGFMSAATVISVLPLIILFFSAQKYFVEGITLTGIKG